MAAYPTFDSRSQRHRLTFVGRDPDRLCHRRTAKRDIKMHTCRQIILAGRPKGPPTMANFRLEAGPLPVPSEGQLLLQTKYLSLEPYVRGRMNDAKSNATPIELGEGMAGEVIAEILASRHDGYREGELVQGRIGWRTHAAVPADKVRRIETGGNPL